MKKLKVLIADDHRMMAAALRSTLRGDDGIEVVGEARNGREVLALLRSARPDAVLLDVAMPEMDGFTCLGHIRRRFPGIAVLMLSASTDTFAVADARRRGARGYLAKTVTPRELTAALRRSLRPGEFLTAGVDERELPALSDRELVVLAAVSRGLTNRQIAHELWITEQTVKFHLRNIFRKLGVANRSDAVRCADRHAHLVA